MAPSGRRRTGGLELGQIAAQGALLAQAKAGHVRQLVLYWGRARALAELGLEGADICERRG